jgi:tetratricopeptide (TPR) repeat protein
MTLFSTLLSTDPHSTLTPPSLQAKSFDRACELYMESLKDGPWDVKTLTNLAQVHIKTKNYDDAMEFLSRTLYLDAKHVKALSRKAFIESERREFEEALVTIEKALALEPANLDLIDQVCTDANCAVV